jgi:hypothetical protein
MKMGAKSRKGAMIWRSYELAKEKERTRTIQYPVTSRWEKRKIEHQELQGFKFILVCINAAGPEHWTRGS